MAGVKDVFVDLKTRGGNAVTLRTHVPDEDHDIHHGEIARNSVESQRPSTFIDYATLAPFAIGCLEAALVIDDSNSGICLWPMTLRNWRSATSRPEPAQRSI